MLPLWLPADEGQHLPQATNESGSGTWTPASSWLAGHVGKQRVGPEACPQGAAGETRGRDGLPGDAGPPLLASPALA